MKNVLNYCLDIWKRFISENMIKSLLLLVSAFLVLATGIGGFLIMKGIMKNNAQAALTFAVIIGVISLLVTVTLVAVAFSLLKMNDNTEALALPKHSRPIGTSDKAEKKVVGMAL
jgi:urea transporter